MNNDILDNKIEELKKRREIVDVGSNFLVTYAELREINYAIKVLEEIKAEIN